ncbi:MAG: class I SAM-dependent methyltransferase [Acidobacteriia bacterium]|nr:class I SAM-dependent methyltransferase [Terriglobia bacterium]
MSFAFSLFNQCRKPNGWLGQLNLWSMNRRHSKVTDWGLQQVSIRSRDTLLDVGCGGGRTVSKLAAIAVEGKVYGVDFSAESVAVSCKTNRKSIADGRVEIRQNSVSQLPFHDRMFDLVTAAETHYYWPDLPANFQEVMRVLKAGGTFLLIAEAYKGGKYDQMLRRLEELKTIMTYAHLTVEEHRDLFNQTGFQDVQVLEKYEKGWICAWGKKPA